MEFLILIFFILVNGVLAIAEASVREVRKSQLSTDANKGDASAKRALQMAENPEKFVSVIQTCITFLGILTGIYCGEKVVGKVEHFYSRFSLPGNLHLLAVITVVFAISFLLILFGEQMPRRIGSARPELFARLLAGPLLILEKLLSPLVKVMNIITRWVTKIFEFNTDNAAAVTEEEIKAIITEGTETGTIQEIEKDIVENVFHLGDRSINSLMTPRINITWLDERDEPSINKTKIIKSIHSVFPVCAGDLDKISGVVHVKDLLAAQLADQSFDLQKYMRQPLYFSENSKAFKALEKFQETKKHFAVVVDEFGSVSGIVTMNDLLDALVGDFEQDYEQDEEIVERADGSFIVDASVPFADFARYFEINIAGENEINEYNTVGGLVFNLAREIPKTGALFSWKGFTIEVLDLDGKRIDKLLVKRRPLPG